MWQRIEIRAVEKSNLHGSCAIRIEPIGTKKFLSCDLAFIALAETLIGHADALPQGAAVESVGWGKWLKKCEVSAGWKIAGQAVTHFAIAMQALMLSTNVLNKPC
ncbi:MAG: hypothetical protein ACYCUV_01825 [Phycisphaerae bacterium]